MANDYNRGIEYRPKLKYDLGEIDPTQYHEHFKEASTEEITQEYISSQDLKRDMDELQNKIDFLLDYARNVLKDEEGFEEYNKPIQKRNYCREHITNSQKEDIKDFKDKFMVNKPVTDIIKEDIREEYKKRMAIEFYELLLIKKRELEDAMEDIENIADDEKESFNQAVNDLDKKYKGVYWDDGIDAAKEALEYDTHRESLFENDQSKETLNRLLKREKKLEEEKEELKQKWKEKSEQDGKAEEAKEIREEIEDVDKELSKNYEKVGFTASYSRSIYEEINSTDSFLSKAANSLLASAFDRIGDTVCCLIKLILTQLGIDREKRDKARGWVEETEHDYKEEVSKFRKETIVIGDRSISLQQMIDGIDSFKSIIYVLVNKKHSLYLDTKNKIEDMTVRAPIRAVITVALRYLRKFELYVVEKAEEGLESVLKMEEYNNYKNPGALLDCLFFERFADLIYDEIENIFNSIYEKLTEFKKVNIQTRDLFDEDTVHLHNEDRLLLLYEILSALSKVLKTVDNIAEEILEAHINDTLTEWIEGFLIDSGFGTTYNPETGQYEEISLDDCIDIGEYTGYSREYEAFSINDVPDMVFDEDTLKEYRDWLKEGKDFEIKCDYKHEDGLLEAEEDEIQNRYEELLENEEKLLNELNIDIDKLDNMSEEEIKDYVDNHDFDY